MAQAIGKLIASGIVDDLKRESVKAETDAIRILRGPHRDYSNMKWSWRTAKIDEAQTSKC